MRLAGKVALVTGGTWGIGRGTVEMFAREGAAVGFTGRSEDTGLAVERAVLDAGGRAMFIKADNGFEEQISGAVETTVGAFGELTTLVNNAISNDDVGSGRDSHVDVMDNETFDNIIKVALKGAFGAASTPSPTCGEPATARSSTSRPAPANSRSRTARRTNPRRARSTRSPDRWRPTLARRTSGPTPSSWGSSSTAVRRCRRCWPTPSTERRSRRTCSRQLGEPSDIAAGATYLASDEAKYVTGTQLTVDGGALCHQPLPELDFEALQEAAGR